MENDNPKYNPYLRYSGMAMQMLVTIGAGVFLGIKLDEWLGTHTPWFTIGCSLFFIAAALISLIRSLPKS
ncbi:MAG: AtpZ/AtpI family protein [Siphonobacter sp.]